MHRERRQGPEVRARDRRRWRRRAWREAARPADHGPQAIVRGQVGDLVRRAARGQVAGRREEPGLQVAQLARDQAARARAPDPQREIDAAGERHDLVGQLEPEPHRRALAAEPRQERREQRAGRVGGGGERDLAGRDRARRRHRRDRALELAERAGDPAGERLALGRGRDAAGRAHEQPHAQVALEGADHPAHARAVDAQRPGRDRERSGLDDPLEDLQVVQVH
jgi:hypothetical protein